MRAWPKRKQFRNVVGMSRVVAYSLVELLCCVAIVLVLAGTALVCYQGSVDNQDLKVVAPAVAERLSDYRDEAIRNGEVITVSFAVGTDSFVAEHKKSGIVTNTNTSHVNDWKVGLFGRKLKFVKYEWPDNSKAAATFTFAGTAAPQGGIVHFGSAYAEQTLRVAGNKIVAQ